MYIRTISRNNRDGSKVTYVQLAHNVRDKEKGFTRAEVLHTFGRADALDVDALRRLVGSICRFISPEDAIQAQAALSKDARSLRFIRSSPMGGAYLLRGLWERIGLPRVMEKIVADRSVVFSLDWAVFAMVANRALDPDSKRGVAEWVACDVALGNPEPVALQHMYRAMDMLEEHDEPLQREVYFATADLLNLEVDLIFFDTTSTYMERDEEDDEGLRRYGKSKDHRGDLPQVVIGLAVTRSGIPVRCWVMPGNTADMATVERVQADMGGWKLSRCVWVMDRGMNSAENRRILQRAGGQWILGEKLRDRQEVHREVLSCRGRYRKIRDNLMIKETTAGKGLERRRFVIVYNPEEAAKDRVLRERHLKRIEEEIAVLKGQHTRKACGLLSHRTLGRYLKKLKGGAIRIDRSKVRDEEHLDGKYLLSTSDPELGADDVALGYKQLMEVERAFRTLKTTLDLRPMYHRKDERIRAHVLVCFLALLLVRIAEVETKQSWDRIRDVMQRMHSGEFSGPSGRACQRTESTQEQSNLLKALGISSPKTIFSVDSAS